MSGKKSIAEYSDTGICSAEEMMEYYAENDPEKYGELFLEGYDSQRVYFDNVFSPDYNENTWDDFCYTLGARLIECNPDLYFKIVASDIGWLHRSGVKYVSLKYAKSDYEEEVARQVGQEFMSSMYPRGFEGSVQIFRCHAHGTEFVVKNHDNPVNGDRYRVTKCAQSTYENNRY